MPIFAYVHMFTTKNMLTYVGGSKEGCNRGHGLSAAIKLGSLEKTVGASLIALWCVLSSPFL